MNAMSAWFRNDRQKYFKPDRSYSFSKFANLINRILQTITVTCLQRIHISCSVWQMTSRRSVYVMHILSFCAVDRLHRSSLVHCYDRQTVKQSIVAQSVDDKNAEVKISTVDQLRRSTRCTQNVCVCVCLYL